jgi:recombination protein RecT
MTQTPHYEGIPGGRKGNGALVQYDAFEAELNERSQSIASMLPSTVSIDRFKNTVIAAVRQDPDILKATIRSVMAAVVRAAQDGLVPDGREGHIAVYNTNVADKKKNEPDRWEKRAQWNPMAHGLRKRLRELDGVIANTEVVHGNDTFVWRQGDDPKIEHEPAKLGTPRGDMIGAYCIYKREDGTILHREVMDKAQIEMTRNQSKAKDSLMWTKFQSEGYRKSVLRRGIKTVPVCDTMREIIQRDDADNFDFSKAAEPALTLVPPSPPPAPPSPSIEHKQTVPMPDLGAPQPELVPLSEADQRAIDRDGFRDMAHQTPEHDPETGEVGPRALPLPERNKQPDFVAWGTSIIGAFKAAQSVGELSQWLQENTATLDSCEECAPRAYSSVIAAYKAQAATLGGAA